MKKLIVISVVFAIAVITASSKDNITFAFTSNLLSQLDPIETDSGQIGGAARMSSAIRNLRLTSDRFILFDTGNHFAGRFYREFRGMPEVELMNEFHYDAVAAGATELSIGEDIFDNWAKFARFPLLITNLIAPPQCKICRHIVSYTIVDRVGLTVGVFALLPSELEYYGRLPEQIGIDPDFIAVSREIVSILDEKSDIIVLLSQLDIESNVILANEVCEIDLIMVNSWAGYENRPLVIESESGCITIIGYAGTRGRTLGVVNSTWDELGNLIDFDWRPIEMDDSIPLDPKIHDIVGDYTNRDDAVSIGVTTVELDGREAVVNVAESNLGNMIADACREAFPDADLAMVPGGAIYGDVIIEPGNITDEQIKELLPYGETVVLLEVKGELLITCMERAVSNIDRAFEGFMQLSGVSVVIDTSKEAQIADPVTEEIKESGSRVREFIIRGEKLDDDKTYKIVTTDFVAEGGYGYYWLKPVPHITGREISDIVIDYINANSPIGQEYENRIVIEP